MININESDKLNNNKLTKIIQFKNNKKKKIFLIYCYSYQFF